MDVCTLISLDEELEKLADVTTRLQPHQQRVVNRIQQENQPGLVVAHGLGSGKTLTSIAAQDALGMPADVIVPAALQENYRKEIKKHTKGNVPKAQVQSMQNLATKRLSPKREMMVVDEAHRMRDPSSSTFQTLKGSEAKKRLLLTGSPFYNHPADIGPLIDLAANSKVLPFDREEFTRKYIAEKTINPNLLQRGANFFRSEENKVRPGTVPILYQKRAPELQEIFKKWVDYHPGKAGAEGYPEVEHKNVPVQMTPDQLRVYDTLMDKAPAWVAAKVKRGLPPNKREAQQLNAFLTAARQATNTTAPFTQDASAVQDPKIQQAFDSLQKTLKNDPQSRAVVYSNFLKAGIDPYKARLDAAKIPYGEFTGEMSKQKRDEMVRQYNAGKLRTLLLSSAGGEGLDLKGTRLMQILEPHWNQEKIKQVEGRGARYQSHSDLPPAARKMLIENYIATRPQGVTSKVLQKIMGRAPDKSVDEYLSQMSGDKEKLIEQFRALLPRHKEKTSAHKEQVTARSKELASSLKPQLAAAAAYATPMALMGHRLGALTGRKEGKLIGTAMGALLGLKISDLMVKQLVPQGKALAKQAIRVAAKENTLREGAGKMDYGQIASSGVKQLLMDSVMSVPPIVQHVLIHKKVPVAALGSMVAGTAIGALGSGYLDKYRRMIAVNELDNVRAAAEVAAADKLKRLRKQVSALEIDIEGDGWKPPTEKAEKVKNKKREW